jgi:alpha-N-arabinofuranosidase
LTADRKFLTVAAVNATERAQPLDLRLSGMKLARPSTFWQITGASLDAANRVGQPAQVQVKESQVDPDGALTVAPISINVYRFPVRE